MLFIWIPADLCQPKRRRRRKDSRSEDETAEREYCYGWTDTDTSIVIVWSLFASSRGDAEQQLDSLKSRPSLPKIERELLSLVAQACNCRTDAGMPTSLTLPCIDLTHDEPRSCSRDMKPQQPNIIVFDVPRRASYQFFSLDPLQLDLNSYTAPSRRRLSAPSPSRPDAALRYKLGQSIDSSWTTPSKPSVIHLETVLAQINHVSTFRLHEEASRPKPVPALLKRLNAQVTMPARLAMTVAASAILRVFNTPLVLNDMSLNDLSATVQQIDVRLSQTSTWSNQLDLIYAPHFSDSPSMLAKRRAHYIQLYNTLWLIANDVIIGTACMSFCLENSDYLADKLGEGLHTLCLTYIVELVNWLDSWPMGIKLNDELSGAFRAAIVACTQCWYRTVLEPITPWLPTIIRLLAFSGLAGTTMFLSALSDLLALLTCHIFLVYVSITWIFAWHVRLLDALFNLFRGRKYNVLRKRVEPASYDADQLLLGTLLFVLAAFLFPTVLAYYLSFAMCRLAIVGTHAVLEAQLAFLNHFPLFAVMLRFKDPKRLPGGLSFEIVNDETLLMQNKPLALSGIFFQHIQLSRRLASHYSPLYLIGRLLTGRMISPIARVRLRLDVRTDTDTASNGGTHSKNGSPSIGKSS